MKNPKFSKGQVVAIRSERFRSGPKYFRIVLREERLGLTFYGDNDNPQYEQSLLRPLTKKEMGTA